MNWSFLKGKSDDAASAPISTDSVATSPQSPASGAVAMAREEIRSGMETSGKRRGRPRKSEESSASDTAAIRAEILAQQLEGVYDEKAWGALLTLPGDAAHTFTGREYWKIGNEERKTLGATGSAAARALMVSDPRALAFLMVASAVFSVYVPRAIQEMRFQREEQAKKKRGESSVESHS